MGRGCLLMVACLSICNDGVWKFELEGSTYDVVCNSNKPATNALHVDSEMTIRCFVDSERGRNRSRLREGVARRVVPPHRVPAPNITTLHPTIMPTAESRNARRARTRKPRGRGLRTRTGW